MTFSSQKRYPSSYSFPLICFMHIPSQLSLPSPKNPSLHVQLSEPLIFSHVALTWQLHAFFSKWDKIGAVSIFNSEFK